MSLQREIKVLEEKLEEVEGWERRVKELETLLGVQEGVGGDDDGEVEGDRDELEETLLREREKEEQEQDAGDVEEGSSVVSASLVSISEGSEVQGD